MADRFRLFEGHKGVFRMVGVGDGINEVTKPASLVAGLSKPHDPAPGEHSASCKQWWLRYRRDDIRLIEFLHTSFFPEWSTS